MVTKLVELIYDAALDETRWEDFLHQTALDFETGPAVMSLHDLRGGRTQLNASTRFDASWTTEYQQHYSALNPWVKSGKIRPGLVAQGEELFPQEMLERTEYYNDFALKTDSVFTLGVALAVSGPTVFYLSVNRGLKQGTFESKDLLLMQSPQLSKLVGEGRWDLQE